jgi:hypothetical protein
MKESNTLSTGELVEIISWRDRDKQERIGVVMRSVKESALSSFSRYEILVNDEVVSIRRDMLKRVKSKTF